VLDCSRLMGHSATSAAGLTRFGTRQLQPAVRDLDSRGPGREEKGGALWLRTYETPDQASLEGQPKVAGLVRVLCETHTRCVEAAATLGKLMLAAVLA
jgi:hypothetical protein